MKTVNTHEAKTHLSRLLERVANGEEFIIARAGKPIARLIGYRGESRARVGGHWRGLVRIGSDFDEPLPEDFERSFREPS